MTLQQSLQQSLRQKWQEYYDLEFRHTEALFDYASAVDDLLGEVLSLSAQAYRQSTDLLGDYEMRIRLSEASKLLSNHRSSIIKQMSTLSGDDS